MRIVWIVCSFLTCAVAGVRERGAELEAAHRWDDAVQLYRSALEELPAVEMEMRLWLLTSLTEVEFNRQDYGAAERWVVQAERLCLPENAAGRVRLLTARGTLHLVRGNLTAAEHELRRAVELSASIGAPEDRAAALHDLAAIEMHTGDLDDAVAHEHDALAIWIDRLGDRHEYVLKAWISLSTIQGLHGDWSGAERSLRKALAIRECNEAIANYAVVLEHMRRRKDAQAMRARLGAGGTPAAIVVDVKSVPTPIRTQ